MNIVVAACKNRGIGVNNKLPWNIKNELQYFKQLTIGNGNNAVVMGKNTWLSLKKPLPKRSNFVLSTTLQCEDLPQDVKLIKDIKSINNLHNGKFFDNIWLIGGESLYRSMIYNVNLSSIFYTEIHQNYVCDTFFPCIPQHFDLYFQSNRIHDDNETQYGKINSYTYNIFKNNEYIPNTEPIILYKEAKNKLVYENNKKYYKKQCKLYA